MPHWTAFPHDATAFTHSAAALKKHWAELHLGDAEPLPHDAKLLAAWGLYHAGQFQQAFEAAMKLGVAGVTLASKAQAFHAHYLLKNEKARHAALKEAAARALAHTEQEPDNPNAHFMHAYALGRYSQDISVLQALSEGLGVAVKGSFERAIALEPRHADATLGLANFHAEVIEKVGKLVGKTQGADAATALKLARRAAELDPDDPITLCDLARILLIIEGPKRKDEAAALRERAAACKAVDAVRCMDLLAAQHGLKA